MHDDTSQPNETPQAMILVLGEKGGTGKSSLFVGISDAPRRTESSRLTDRPRRRRRPKHAHRCGY